MTDCPWTKSSAGPLLIHPGEELAAIPPLGNVGREGQGHAWQAEQKTPG